MFICSFQSTKLIIMFYILVATEDIEDIRIRLFQLQEAFQSTGMLSKPNIMPFCAIAKLCAGWYGSRKSREDLIEKILFTLNLQR